MGVHKQSRERDQALLEAEVRRRLELPLDRWETVEVPDEDDATRRETIHR